MDNYRRGSHSVYLLTYHIIFVTKYRKKVITDEMSTMLDAITQMQIWQVLMEEVRARGLGMLVITHNMARANRLCDRIIKKRRSARTAI